MLTTQANNEEIKASYDRKLRPSWLIALVAILGLIPFGMSFFISLPLILTPFIITLFVASLTYLITISGALIFNSIKDRSKFPFIFEESDNSGYMLTTYRERNAHHIAGAILAPYFLAAQLRATLKPVLDTILFIFLFSLVTLITAFFWPITTFFLPIILITELFKRIVDIIFFNREISSLKKIDLNDLNMLWGKSWLGEILCIRVTDTFKKLFVENNQSKENKIHYLAGYYALFNSSRIVIKCAITVLSITALVALSALNTYMPAILFSSLFAFWIPLGAAALVATFIVGAGIYLSRNNEIEIEKCSVDNVVQAENFRKTFLAGSNAADVGDHAVVRLACRFSIWQSPRPAPADPAAPNTAENPAQSLRLTSNPYDQVD